MTIGPKLRTSKLPKRESISKGKDGNTTKGFIVVGKNLPIPPALEKASFNHFDALSILESYSLEEGELPQLEGLIDAPELNTEILDQTGVSNSKFPRECEPLQHSPIGVNSSPSYANITRKK